MKRRKVVSATMLVLCLMSRVASAEELPSVFRGMTVGDGSPGVVVVFVKDDAFALASGLRAGDHIIAVEDRVIHALEDFAEASRLLAGKRTDVTVTVVRNGARFTAEISLTSPAVRSAWGLAFVPDFSLHFVDAKAARRYWSRRAAQELIAGKDLEAMRSLLNVLHYAPDAYDEALALCETVQRQGERLWKQAKRSEALGVIQQAVALYRQAATKPLTSAQWARVKRGLQQLSDTLKQPQALMTTTRNS